MKRIVFVLLSALIMTNISIAQEESSEKHFEYTSAIKFSPIEFGRSYFEVTYQKYFGDRSHSLLISPTFMLKESAYESFSGMQLMLNYRFHLNHLKKGEHNTWGMYNIDFYAGPYLTGTIYNEDFKFGYYDDRFQTYTENDYKKDVQAIETGVFLGVQFDITPRIILDLYGGGGVRYASNSNNIPENLKNMYFTPDGVFEIEYTGVKPNLGLQIGFTF